MNDPSMVNVDQAAEWEGPEGEHWVAHQQRYEDMSAGFTPALLNAAAIAPTHEVLDIGCGCGATTRLAAHTATQGHALGVDLSGPMLRQGAADAAAEGLTNIAFQRADAQVHPFPSGSFDVAISRFGVMFFVDPVAAFTNIATALVSGGRLMFLCWQDLARNDWVTVPAGAALAHVPFPDLGAPDQPGPFSLADPNHISDVLAAAGYTDITTTGIEAPMRLGDNADDAVAFLSGIGVARTLLATVDPDTAQRALTVVRDALAPYDESPDGVTLTGAAWLVTARRP
jgi:SAM-dependent methyltransferase